MCLVMPENINNRIKLTSWIFSAIYMFSFCKVFYFTFSVSSGWHKGVKVFFDTRFQLFRFATVFFSFACIRKIWYLCYLWKILGYITFTAVFLEGRPAVSVFWFVSFESQDVWSLNGSWLQVTESTALALWKKYVPHALKNLTHSICPV